MARIKLSQWAEESGFKLTDSLGELTPDALDCLQEIVSDSICPVLCDECDDVEPDGHCEHGHPSVLLALGMI